MQSQEYERIKDLAVRHAQGLTDEAEERELQAWRESKPEREAMFRRMMSRQQLEENIRRFAKTPEEEEQAWQRILERTVRREKRLRVRQWTRVAAMFLLPVAAGILAWWALERGSQRTEIAEKTYTPNARTLDTLSPADMPIIAKKPARQKKCSCYSPKRPANKITLPFHTP